MADLLAARLQMAVSLGFHILFAVAGMAMPALMVLAERRHQKTGEVVYLEVAQRWAKGTAILFAVGVNAFMNTPRGFVLAADGTLTDVDLWKAFFTPAFPTQACTCWRRRIRASASPCWASTHCACGGSRAAAFTGLPSSSCYPSCSSSPRCKSPAAISPPSTSPSTSPPSSLQPRRCGRPSAARRSSSAACPRTAGATSWARSTCRSC